MISQRFIENKRCRCQLVPIVTGQNIEVGMPEVNTAIKGALCPFMNAECSKVRKGNKPVCCVRKTTGDIWIVCEHRLCATVKRPPLSEYQRIMLHDVAKCLFGEDTTRDDIVVKREERIHVVEGSFYKADYIMMNINDEFCHNKNGPARVVLEMQGGGETSSTGAITRHIENWEKLDDARTNENLGQSVAAGTIETNAWRRQQEQFIVKGNIAQQTGGGIVFCVGKPLFDYLYARVQEANLRDLRTHNWSLALIGFDETDGKSSVKDAINYRINPETVLFTNYVSFVQTLINQGGPAPEMFEGEFELLNGAIYKV